TSVASSDSQYCNRSLPDTSARLPMLANQIAKQRAADRLRIAAGPDHRDGSRREHRAQRRALGFGLLRLGGRLRDLAVRDRAFEMRHAVAYRARQGVPRLAKDREHYVVVDQHVGAEAIDAMLARDLSQQVEQ